MKSLDNKRNCGCRLTVNPRGRIYWKPVARSCRTKPETRKAKKHKANRIVRQDILKQSFCRLIAAGVQLTLSGSLLLQGDLRRHGPSSLSMGPGIRRRDTEAFPTAMKMPPSQIDRRVGYWFLICPPEGGGCCCLRGCIPGGGCCPPGCPP